LSRYQIIVSGDNIIPLTVEIFNKIILSFEEITENINNDKDIFEQLQRIVNVVFLASGNGFYLKDKGLIQF